MSLIAENPKRYLEISKARKVTFDELAEKYEENFNHQRSFATSKKHSIERLKKEFSGRLLGSISFSNSSLSGTKAKIRSASTEPSARKPQSMASWPV